LATYAPFVGIYFVSYEKSKLMYKNITNAPSVNNLPFLLNLVSGAQAGAISAAITCPMDVVKTRLQVQSGVGPGDKYLGTLNAIVRILKEEGIQAFGKGMTARILWISPATAITIAVYEFVKASLQ